MAASPSDARPAASPAPGRLTRTAQEFEALSRPERIGVVAMAVFVGSMFLPWFGIPFATDLVITGWGAFGFIEAAMLLALGGTVMLLLGGALGLDIRLPLRPGMLMTGAGAWTLALLAVRAFDRPTIRLGNVDIETDVRYGIWIAGGAALTVVLAGLAARARARAQSPD